MTLDKIQLTISTPTEPILPGRGFYQLEEEALHVQVGPMSPHRRFYSYLESDCLHLDLDKQGRLIFIELDLSRRHWPPVENLTPPTIAEPAAIRWLDFRQGIPAAKLACSAARTMLRLAFQPRPADLHYYLAEHVIAGVTGDNELATIWITDIVDDLAGQEIAAFRKSLRPVLASD